MSQPLHVGPVCHVCGCTRHRMVSHAPGGRRRYECTGCEWLWFATRCKVKDCTTDAEPGAKVCVEHHLHQCPGMHGCKYSGTTVNIARELAEADRNRTVPPTRRGPYLHRQCWNIVKPGSLCWAHRDAEA